MHFKNNMNNIFNGLFYILTLSLKIFVESLSSQ